MPTSFTCSSDAESEWLESVAYPELEVYELSEPSEPELYEPSEPELAELSELWRDEPRRFSFSFISTDFSSRDLLY